MIIQPKIRGFICTTAHPQGCAEHVKRQIEYVKSQKLIDGPRKVLVIGASTGYGLASRIAAAFGAGADTIGVFFERPASGERTASAGWYNTAAFTQAALSAGRYAGNVNGDAFSDEIKQKTIDLIKEKLGKVDLIVYSLASPRRKHPRTGETLSSVIKPTHKPFASKSVNTGTGEVSQVTIEPATEEELRHTIGIMGGEDWEMWIDELRRADALAAGAVTVAYSYIGPEVTHAIYRDGTIGKAKDHLESTAHALTQKMLDLDGHAYVSVNKALVTQASSAIPVVPLYISLLFKVMKEQGLHEDTIEQMYRLLADRLYAGHSVQVDEKGRIRLDELEMKPEVQETVDRLWERADTENLEELSDMRGYRDDFLKLFGFGLSHVNYEADVDPDVPIPNLVD